jgi:hypothetical protein
LPKSTDTPELYILDEIFKDRKPFDSLEAVHAGKEAYRKILEQLSDKTAIQIPGERFGYMGINIFKDISLNAEEIHIKITRCFFTSAIRNAQID